MTKLNNSLQGNPVNNKLLGTNQDGYKLTWDNTDGYWDAEPNFVNYTVYPTGNLTLFTEKIEPYMNITVEYLSTVTTFAGTTVSSALGTTIDTPSNNTASSSSTIFVVSTAGFPLSGSIWISSSDYPGVLVNYTNTTGTSFTGCTQSGSTTTTFLYTGQQVSLPMNLQTTVDVVSTTGFPTSGNIFVSYPSPSNAQAELSYTGVTGTSFTGCTFVGSNNGPFLVGAVVEGSFSSVTTIDVVSTDNFPSSGTAYLYGSTSFSFTYTGITGTSFTGCTVHQDWPIATPVTISYIPASFTYLAMPTGIPFTANFTNLANPFYAFLATSSGTSASLVAATSTTITSASNGLTTGQPTINVVDTTGFPSSGILGLVSGSVTAFIYYSGVTGTSFTGCSIYSGSYNVMTTGDVVYPCTFNMLAEGLTNVSSTDTLIVLGDTGSTNDGAFNIINDVSSTSLNTIQPYILDDSDNRIYTGTLPDSNNGNIIWAISTFIVGEMPLINTNPDNGFANYCISDGNLLSVSQTPLPFIAAYGANTYDVVDGFNYAMPVNGNLESTILHDNGLSAAFQAAIQGTPAVLMSVSNTTGFAATVGYSFNGTSFTGNTVTIPAGEANIIAGDGTNVFAPIAVASSPNVVVNSTSYTISSDPSGTTYLVNCSSAPSSITLPAAPDDGTYYIFKDQSFTYNSPLNLILTVLSSGSDSIQDNVNFTTRSSLVYNMPGLSFTLLYSAVSQIWLVVNKTDNELAPLWIYAFEGSDYDVSDLRQQDYIIDTSYGLAAITFHTYDQTIGVPFDGQVFSLKDGGIPNGSWASWPVTVQTSGGSYIEYPAGIFNAGSVVLSNNGQYAKWRWAEEGVWFLLESNVSFYGGNSRPTTSTIGFMFFDTTLTGAGTGGGGPGAGLPIWWNGTEWLDANGNIV